MQVLEDLDRLTVQTIGDPIMLNREHGAHLPHSSRRHFFRTAVGAMSVGVTAVGGATRAADPPPKALADEIVVPLTKSDRDALSPDEVIARLKTGNERFRTG